MDTGDAAPTTRTFCGDGWSRPQVLGLRRRRDNGARGRRGRRHRSVRAQRARAAVRARGPRSRVRAPGERRDPRTSGHQAMTRESRPPFAGPLPPARRGRQEPKDAEARQTVRPGGQNRQGVRSAPRDRRPLGLRADIRPHAKYDAAHADFSNGRKVLHGHEHRRLSRRAQARRLPRPPALSGGGRGRPVGQVRGRGRPTRHREAVPRPSGKTCPFVLASPSPDATSSPTPQESSNAVFVSLDF